VSTVSGSAVRDAKTVPTDVPRLQESVLDSVLLPIDEINDIMGTTDLEITSDMDEMTDSSDKVSNQDCLGAMFGAEEPVYEGSGWTAVRDVVAREPDEDNDHWIEQTAGVPVAHGPEPTAGPLRHGPGPSQEPEPACSGCARRGAERRRDVAAETTGLGDGADHRPGRRSGVQYGLRRAPGGELRGEQVADLDRACGVRLGQSCGRTTAPQEPRAPGAHGQHQARRGERPGKGQHRDAQRDDRRRNPGARRIVVGVRRRRRARQEEPAGAAARHGSQERGAHGDNRAASDASPAPVTARPPPGNDTAVSISASPS